MNLTWLITFKHVVETSSYTKAADSLFLTQPAVSQQVRQLERFFGAKLILRVGHEVQLTAPGRQVYDLACRVEADLDATSRGIRELLQGAQAVVTLASAPSPLLHMVPDVLNHFWTDHPDVAVKTFVKFGHAITEAVRSGAADLGIHTETYLDRTLEAVELGSARLVAVCADRHPLAAKPVIAGRDIADRKVAVTSTGTGTRKAVDDWFASRGLTLHNVMEVSSHEEIRIAAIENLAVGFTGLGTVAEDLRVGRLVQIPLEGFGLSRRSYVSFRKNLEAPATWLRDAIVESVQDRQESSVFLASVQ